MPDFIRSLYGRFRQAFPINRIVALLAAPAAALGGYVAVWVAENFPGVTVGEESLTAIFITGAAAVVVMAVRWLDGFMRYEGTLMALDADDIKAQRQEARKQQRRGRR